MSNAMSDNGKTIAQMTEEVYDNNVEKGWQPSENTFAESMMMLVTEVAEAVEAFRDHGLNDATADHYDRMHGLCVHGEPRGCCSDGKLSKPEGVGSELADVLIRLLDTCYTFNVDLVSEYERKMEYNRTRSYRHGGRTL